MGRGAGAGWRRDDTVDALLAAGATALTASVLLEVGSRGELDRSAAAWLLAVAHTAPVATRRRAPRASFAVSLAAATAYLAIGAPMVGLGLAALVMTYSLASTLDRAAGLAGLAAAVVVVLAVGRSGDAGTVVGNVLALAAAWVLGDSARRRREQAVRDHERAARDAAAAERLRIARELHDVVAHSMSVIAVQAGTGRMVVDDDPAGAGEALRAIERTSRQALDEMRRLLGVLRTDAGPAALEPLPGLDAVEGLVADAAAAGTPVDVEIDGDRGAAPPGVALAAYRVVQEALTNARRHAPGEHAAVRLSVREDRVEVEVANHAPRAHAAGAPGGHGLAGMRERVSLYGGRIDAGREADGTFRVRASIPFDGDRP